jgi:hypothetical protein
LTYQVTASHGASVFNATGLPDGLTIDPATGIIAGTPAVAGTRQVVLTASNRDRTGTAILTVTIMANQAPVISASASVSIPDLVLP